MTPSRILAAVAAAALTGCATWYATHIPVLDGPALRDYTTREEDLGRCVMGAKLPVSYEVKRPQYTLKWIPHPSTGNSVPDFEITVITAGAVELRAVGVSVVPLGTDTGAKRFRLTAASDGPFQLMVMSGERVLGIEELNLKIEDCHSLMWGG